MKNQYFGDKRDLFKYDLITKIVEGINSIKYFTFIPMLTDNDGKSDGNKRNLENSAAGAKNKCLVDFLNKYKNCDKNLRDFRKIRQYFELKKIDIKIYEENNNRKYFDHKGRADYFKKIDDFLLPNSLIFVDPDNGLQIEKSNKKHLLYSEVNEIYKRMDENSILMIYQHFPRARYKYEKYMPDGRSNKLKEIGDLPIYISDNEIIFFFLTKKDKIKNQLTKIIIKYQESYQSLKIGNVNLGGSYPIINIAKI